MNCQKIGTIISILFIAHQIPGIYDLLAEYQQIVLDTINIGRMDYEAVYLPKNHFIKEGTMWNRQNVYKSRLINGQIFDEDYFDHLISEIQEINKIVTMYLDYATRQARRHIPMTMAD